MRKRAVTLLLAVVAAGALVVATVGPAGASVDAKKKAAPLCAGKTKKAAYAGIKLAYKAFLDGKAFPDAASKEPYLQLLSGKTINAAFKAKFEASAAANAASAATTAVAVDKITCTSKKKAAVVFTLVLGGTRAEGLAPPGTAILEGNTWKVTGVTICNLQALGDPSVITVEPCLTIVNKG